MDEQTRKALELAREALFAPMNTTKFHQAIAAINAALSAPAAPVAQWEPEPVAVIGDTFALLWASGEPISDIAKRHGLKVGSKLYAAPSPAPASQPVSEPSKAVQPLTLEQINQIEMTTEWPEGSLRNIGPRDWGRLLVTATRAIERACAEAWGVKLDGIGQEGGAA